MSELVPVKSSNVQAVGYDHERQALTVQFKGGGSYEYADVPAEKHASLLAAPSIGSYLHVHVKPHHVGRKLA